MRLQVGYSSTRRAAAKFWVDDGWRRRGLKRRLRRGGRIEMGTRNVTKVTWLKEKGKNGSLLSLCVNIDIDSGGGGLFGRVLLFKFRVPLTEILARIGNRHGSRR